MVIAAVAAVFVLLTLGPVAHADGPCDSIKGPAHKYCMQGQEKDGGDGDGGGGLESPIDTTADPLSSLANGVAQAAGWVVDKLSDAVAATSDVDFTNTNFLKSYAIVFAASTFLVLFIWLWAIVKRVVRGAPLTTAFGEAIGLLWLTVLASAFTPLVLYVVVGAVDGITEAIAGGDSDNNRFFAAFSKALTDEESMGDGGPIARIFLALVSILAAGVVWLEMVIRTALLYVGAVLGTVVYSGLVDKALWSRVKKWVGMMVAIIMLKPIIVIVLELASAMSGGGPKDSTAAIISGLSIIIIAIIASAMLFRMVPGMGDEIVEARRASYDPASQQSKAAVTRPVTGIRQGISTHAARDSASRPTAAASTSSASSGISAHSTRPASSGSGSGAGGQAARPARSDVPRQDNRDSSRNGS